MRITAGSLHAGGLQRPHGQMTGDADETAHSSTRRQDGMSAPPAMFLLGEAAGVSHRA